MSSQRCSAGWNIRDADPGDFEAILRLNARWETVTSKLEHDSLARLHACATYHRIVDQESRVVAFLLALGPGVDYDSQNYRWFDSGGADFLYIDRIVVEGGRQRAGLGDALYEDLTAFARRRCIARLVCEVDIEPLNAASDNFHTRQRFVEVGTQWVAAGTRRVSLRERMID